MSSIPTSTSLEHSAHGLPPRHRIQPWMALLLFWPLQVVALWHLDRHAINVEPGAYLEPWSLLANSLVGFSCWLILTALSRRPLASLLLVSLLQAALCWAAKLKLEILDAPLSLPDLYFATAINPASVALFGNYLNLPGGPWPWLVALLVALVLLFVLEPPASRLRGLARAAVLLPGLALVLTLHLASWPWTAIYTKERLRPSHYGPLPSILHGGHVAYLVNAHLEAGTQLPEIDPTALRHVLSITAPPLSATAPETLPDIVIVLSESFIDPHVISGFSELPDLIPNLRAARLQGASGMMRVPTYGGGTIRTEFEVLTGIPIHALTNLTYPFVELHLDHLPGLASVLATHGYRRIAIHGNDVRFWNRSEAYRAMDFENFIAAPDFKKAAAEREAGWYTDQAMTDFILEALASSTAPSFIMAISIQAHGPYSAKAETRDPNARAAITLPDGLPRKAAASARTYFHHLQQADQQFARLHAALEARGKPYVLLFFGDHLPALDLYEHLAFVNGEHASRQLLPWVLLSNLDTHAQVPQYQNIPTFSWQLPALVLARAGIREPWFDFLLAASQQLEAHADDATRFKTTAEGVHAAALSRLQNRFESHLQ